MTPTTFSAYEVVILLAALSSLALACVVLASRPRGRLRWGFSLGMVGFMAEALAVFILITQTESPDDRILWLRAVHIAGLLLLVPWAVFVVALISPTGAQLSPARRIGLAGAAAVALLAAAAVAAFPAFQVSETPGAFYAARVDVASRAGVIAQLLMTVGILAALEFCLRTSKGEGRWRIKYLVLGLGGVFLIRFYLLSHVLLFQVVMASYLTTAGATLLVGNLVIGLSLVRGRLRGAELTVSRQMLFRSIVVGVLGLYLFVVGALGWLLNSLGIPEELFWGSLVVFVSALALAAFLLSETVRWRFRRFIALHFYRSKYDYREQWGKFTKRLGSLVTLEELAPQLVQAVTEAVGTAQGALYLLDGRLKRYFLAAKAGTDRVLPCLDADSALISELRARKDPLRLADASQLALCATWPSATGEENGSPSAPWPAVATPLHWRGSLTGVLLLGAERTGAPYTPEDMDFLGTVAEQAAGAIVTAELSEALAQSREFEAFHRLTSFVIHDLKNSVSALSMLSQNALAHFEEPEFQKDALKTLARTVERMKRLLARLSTAPESAPLRSQAVDLSALVREAVAPLADNSQVKLVQDLAPVPPISGDPEGLLRVIQNLVTNAVEALDGAGVVTVKTYEEGGWAIFSISDTGCGIPDEFLRRSLFAPFRSTKKSGWGIGLYQAKGIAEAHRGVIEVASKEGVGTTFWVRLPIEAG